jgi:23S rRNA pseudouridine1911/1915/1917 synthase
VKTLRFAVTAPDRLDRVLAAAHPDLSRRQARALISAGAVFVDGRRCKVASRIPERGTPVVVHLAPADSTPDPQLLFQDEDIVVVNKPAGLTANESETSAKDALVHKLGPGVRLVHRLDRDTTGVMVLAKSARAAEALSAAFRDRQIDKRYVAVSMGVPPEGWVEAPIGRDERRPRCFTVRPDGRPARTHVAVVGSRDGLAAVRLTLDSGRTHQIRVHLAHLRAPILGDTQYGAKVAARVGEAVLRATRPLLHAEHLGFTLFGVAHAFDAPLPEDLAAVWGRVVGPG